MNIKKCFKPEVLEKLYQDLKTAYEQAPESITKDSLVFDEKTGRQIKSSCTVFDRYLGSKTFLNRRYPAKVEETITIQAGTTIYTVQNTKAHIRILAERVGLMLVESADKQMPVWVGCSGYTKGQTIKVKPVEAENSYLATVYCTG